MPVPEDPEEQRELEREVLDEVVNQMLILNAAAQDTLMTVPEGRLDQETEQAWEDALRRFGSEATMIRALETEGLTIAEYRGSLREEIRKGLLSERFVQTELSEARIVPVEEAEMRAFFDRERESLGERPATITFDQVLLSRYPPIPSRHGRGSARQSFSPSSRRARILGSWHGDFQRSRLRPAGRRARVDPPGMMVQGV